MVFSVQKEPVIFVTVYKLNLKNRNYETSITAFFSIGQRVLFRFIEDDKYVHYFYNNSFSTFSTFPFSARMCCL
jgi:hypothetical protein